MAFLAWALYPTGRAPSRPSPVFVSIGSGSSLLGVSVTISQPLGTDYYEIEVAGTSSERTARAAVPATVWVSLAGDLVLPDPQYSVRCSPACAGQANEFLEGSSLFRFRVKVEPHWSQDASGSSFTSWIRIPKSAFMIDVGGIQDPSVLLPGMVCSPVSCRGSVPVVTASETTQRAPGAYAYVRFADPGLQDYEWSSPLTPYAHVEPGLLFNYPLGQDSGSHFSTQYPADGENGEQQRFEQFKLFLSGALVGLAGALLIAAGQETLDLVRGRGERNRTNCGNGHV